MPLVQDVILGVYIGVLTGIFAAAIVYLLTFAFTYLAGAKLSINYALLIGLGIAGLAGGPRLLLRSPELLQSSTSLVMLVLVLFLSFYAHKSATDLGNAFPPVTVVLRKLRPRSISAGVVRQIGQYGHVTIRPTGEVGDIEGYPPVSDEVRREIRTARWDYPADLELTELERRLEDRLEGEYDLAEATVAIDSEGRATIHVAPTLAGLSRQVPPGTQVVSIEGVLPDGLAPGDDVVLVGADAEVDGRVLQVATDEPRHPRVTEDEEDPSVDDTESSPDISASKRTAERGDGVGRVAVAVDVDDVETVVHGGTEKLYVRSHGQLPVFEFVSRLRRRDLRFKKLAVGDGSPLVGSTLGDLPGKEATGFVVLAVKHDDRWRFAPDTATVIAREDELYVAGPKDGITALREKAA